MKELYIYHYLGLGDHIICNGLVRHYSKLYDKIYLFVKDINFESVKFMYRDLTNIDYIVGTVYYDGRDIFVSPYLNYENLLRVTYSPQPNMNFDECFYQSVNVPFDKRWSDFYFERDIERENKVFDHFNIDSDYIFLHDDILRDMEIDRTHIVDKSLPVITPKIGLTDNIFDYVKVIQNAKEIHCMDSSFRLLCDSIELKTDKIFHHLNRMGTFSSSLKKWIKVDYPNK